MRNLIPTEDDNELEFVNPSKLVVPSIIRVADRADRNSSSQIVVYDTLRE